MDELKAHPEVVNGLPKTLIIGYGWVGRFIGEYFPGADAVDINSFVRGEARERWKYAFICVPTPMNEDGSCDTSAVDYAVRVWKDRVDYFCIKSTVSIGTTDYLQGKYGVNVCFSPEYIGETVGHTMVEPRRDTFIILGGERETTAALAGLFTLVTNSYSRIYQTSSRAAELVKLMENSFIAAKVTFCNEFYGLAREIGVDYNELRELWLADERVSRSHTYVFPENRGFGGKCLPKDLNNLAHYFRQAGRPAEFIEFILSFNKKLRGG